MQRLFKRRLFNLLRQQQPDFDRVLAKKVSVLDGDLSLPGCGLTHADLQLVQTDINYIIHSAANTSFSAPLATLLESNYWVRC